MTRLKVALAAALKAKRTWDRIPPEQRKKIVDSAAATVRTHGPVVAKKVAETARTQGPVVAKKVADTARTRGPVVARKLAEAIERARNGSSK
jgi:acyl-CoA reductase-like NAD-dependent aldehyde dehydrogenase